MMFCFQKEALLSGQESAIEILEKDLANLKLTSQSSDYEKDQQITNLSTDIERLTSQNKSKDSAIEGLEKNKVDVLKQLGDKVIPIIILCQ